MSPDPLAPAAVNPLDPDPPPEAVVREHPGWFLALGLAQVLVGAVALGLAAFTTLLAVVLLGGLALAGAAVELVGAAAARSWPEGLARAVVGLLYGVFGLMLLANPELAAATLTLVLAVLLLATGVTRVAFAATGRYRGWGWAAAGGAVAALLGALIWAGWPGNSLWVIGLFVGIDLVVMGWHWVALALGMRKAEPHTARVIGAA